MAFGNCWDFNMEFPTQKNTTNRHPISSTMLVPHSDRMDEDSVTGLLLSNENTIGPAIDLLALVVREASRDR